MEPPSWQVVKFYAAALSSQPLHSILAVWAHSWHYRFPKVHLLVVDHWHRCGRAGISVIRLRSAGDPSVAVLASLPYTYSNVSSCAGTLSC